MANKIQRTPQEKKTLSYLKDCRNTYGEGNKSSRTSIKFRKRWVNKTYRHNVKQAINSTDVDIDSVAKEVKKKNWKKIPDIPLKEYVPFQMSKRK